ncbi:hypothetical protein [Kluyvera ascorbata]
MIVAVGANVIVWVSKGDVGKYVSKDISSSNIREYTSGNTDGIAGKSDIFILHDGSTYTQGDNTQHAMNAVNGNREASNSTAHDYIFVPGSSSWSNTDGTKNVNDNINYIESVNLTVNGKTFYGNNRLTEIISGTGKEGLDPDHSDSKVAWQYDLSIDATLEGGNDNNITSIKISGLIPKSTINYLGVNYTADDNGNLTIDVPDGTHLDAHLTLTSSTQITDLGSIKVDVVTDVDDSSPSSGPIDANSGDHSVVLASGEDSHADDSTHALSAEEDAHHTTLAHVSTADSTEHTDDVSSNDHSTESDSANLAELSGDDTHTATTDPGDTVNTDTTEPTDNITDNATLDTAGQAEETDSTSDNATTDQDNAALLIDNETIDLSAIEQDASQVQSVANESPETSLSMLLDDIDSHLHEVDSAQDVEQLEDKSTSTAATDTPQAETIDLSEIIHNDSANDVSSMIQVDTPAENTETAGHVQDVPAESSGSEGADSWNAHNIAELDHLISQPDTEA